MAFGLTTLLRLGFRGSVTETSAYFMSVVVGFVFLVIGRTLGRNRPLLIGAAVVVVAAISATVWLGIIEEPPPCADDVTKEGSLAYLRPWLQGQGYSPGDIDSFYVTNVARDPEESWPTYFFYFTGNKNGKLQGVIGVGNGCSIGELQEAKPFTITKVG